MPHRHAFDSAGRRVAFVRELATRDGYRVSLFPGGDHNHSIEGRVPNSEAFAIKMATRWLARRAAVELGSVQPVPNLNNATNHQS